MRSLLSLWLGLSLCGVLLVACGSDQPLVQLPEGEQTISGILKPAEISVARRGTHIIEQDGVEVYYAESALVNLRDYQGKRITVRGSLEHNIDTIYLPVLVVESVVDVEETVEEHILSSLGISFSAPVEWTLVKREGKHQFHLPEETDPIAQIWQESGENLPEGGVPMVVDATRATRLIDELTGTQLVAVKREGSILHLQFIPGSRVTADRLREDFVQLLNSVEIKAADIDPTLSIGTGSLGNPCGGPAGILCPDGFYCDVQNLEENIGRCRQI